MADSVYTYDLTFSDVAARVGATIDDNSKPTSTQVTTWIQEVCAVVNSELEALEVEPTGFTSSANVNQYHRIRHYVAEYVAALWHAANQRDDTDWSSDQKERWDVMILDIRKIAQKWLGSAAPDRYGSHVTETTLESVPSKLRGSSRWFD